MTQNATIHRCDDWISLGGLSSQLAYSIAEQARRDSVWEDAVPSIDSLALRFNPALLRPDDAAARAQQYLALAAQEKHKKSQKAKLETLEIPVCYEPPYALDLAYVAQRLAIKSEDVARWHSSQKFSVAMLGFMPGFAYLKNEEDTATEIGRLPQPRQSIAAGSLGCLGIQSCLYSLDGPGGWPIIGRTPLSLFDRIGNNLALLKPGQKIIFRAIDGAAFEKLKTTTTP